MKSNVIAIAFIMSLFFLQACDKKEDDEVVPKTKEELLAGATSLTWNTVELNPEVDPSNPSCQMSSERNADNKHIFFKTGEFQFDNGVITYFDCEDCCQDEIDLYGVWTLSSAGNFKIVAQGGLENGIKTPFDEEEVLLDGTLKSITETEMVVETAGYTVKYARIM